MSLLKKLAVLVFTFLSASGAYGQTVGSASTFAGLTWSVSTTMAGFASCNQLAVDFTGDFTNSYRYVVYGTLNCYGGSHFSSGNAFFSADGSFNMSVRMGIGLNLVCANLNGATLSGPCAIYDNLGTQTGTAYVSYP